jgi:hypothetical protein
LRVDGFVMGMGGIGTDVGDHVDLEGERQHVGMKTSFGELGGFLRGLGLLEDGLQGLERVLDGHNRGVVYGVRHCENVWDGGQGMKDCCSCLL